MVIEWLQRRGFKPVDTVLHAPDERGIMGRLVLKRRQGKGNTHYYVSAIYKFKDTFRYGEPVLLPKEVM
jgi:hypothetical protein